ncbi:hypothetical protein BTN33_17335, partial [Aeromonas veronii]
GAGLKAVVTLDGGSGKESAAYDIAAATPAEANSAVALDKAAYEVGQPMVVTVTLKDGLGNALSGQGAALTDSTVVVPNTKSEAHTWVDHSDGTYSADYTADAVGAGLKAVVTLDGWSGKESAAYDIAAATPAEANSAVALDKAAYEVGQPMVVTVTLKDGLGNALSGQGAALTDSTVVVPNTKSEAHTWVDHSDGTYSADYTADAVGAGLKAVVTLDGWSGKESAAYDIAAATPAEANSAVALDKAAYEVGQPMVVTVTLKDGLGNALSGQGAALTDSTVVVPNTKSEAHTWVDHSDGTYSADYTADAVGAGLKAVVTLDGWSGKESAAYDIAAATPAEAYSAVALDNTSYMAGETIAVTVTLKDAQGNAMTGQSGLLTDSTVVVPNTTGTPRWTDNGDGTYSDTYTATNAGAGLKATLVLSGWSGVSSAAYAIIPIMTGVTVNGEMFAPDAGFPTTGFTGATFTLNVSGAASDYVWTSSDPSWAPVDDAGKVSFTSQGNASPVTITATPTMGGNPLTYTFTIGSWFTNNGEKMGYLSEVSAFCRSVGLTLPTLAEVTLGERQRGVGSLWSEWGALGSYSGSGFFSDHYWTSEVESISGKNYTVNFIDGGSEPRLGSISWNYFVCRQGL